MPAKEIARFIDDNEEYFIDLSDRIWDYAESAFAEYRSSAVLIETLEKHGFAVEKGIGEIDTAFCGTFSTSPTPERNATVGLLGEFDALLNMSQRAGITKQEELSPGGNGHACGHNMLGVAALAAAIAAKEYIRRHNLAGTVKYYGCPGEEGGSGKAFMAKHGVFDCLDAALTWHPSPINSIMHLATLANYQILYKFKGLSSHAAAAPELGRSALDAVELMNVGVNFLREHIIQEARVHYAITNTGGPSPNVVQSEANVLYLIRAPRLDQARAIYRRIDKIARGAAMMTETELEIDFMKACANVIPNNAISECLYDNYRKVELPQYTEEERAFARAIVESLAYPSSDLDLFSNLSGMELARLAAKMKGQSLCESLIPFDKQLPEKLLAISSDVGDVSWSVPTGQICAASCALGTPLHSWQLTAQGRSPLGHKGLLTAAKVLAASAVDIVMHPEIAEKAKTELKERLGGETYRSPIPDGVQPRGIDSL